MPRILGIDSSLTSSGMCRVDIPTDHADYMPKIDVWTIESKPAADRSAIGMSNRIAEIVATMEPHIAKATVVVLEGISFASSGSGAHQLHWLWGRIVDSCVGTAAELLLVPPSLRMKYATGKGMIRKDAVMAAAIKRFPTVDITDNDTADATILAAIGCRYLGLPIDDVPKTTHWEPVMKKLGR